MNAETIAYALGGRKAGSGWTARCPAHEDRMPSLSIREFQRRQGSGSVPRKVRAGASDRGAAVARFVDRERSTLVFTPCRTPYHRTAVGQG